MAARSKSVSARSSGRGRGRGRKSKAVEIQLWFDGFDDVPDAAGDVQDCAAVQYQFFAVPDNYDAGSAIE